MHAARTSWAGHTRQLIPSPLLQRRRSHILVVSMTIIINVLLPVHGVAETAHPSPPRLIRTPWAPRPPRALRHGQMVPTEREKGADGAHQETKQDVEAVVPKVEPAGGGDEDGGEEGGRRENEEVQGRCGGLATSGGEGGVVCGEEVGG